MSLTLGGGGRGVYCLLDIRMGCGGGGVYTISFRSGWEGCIDCLLHKEWMGGVYRLSLT